MERKPEIADGRRIETASTQRHVPPLTLAESCFQLSKRTVYSVVVKGIVAVAALVAVAGALTVQTPGFAGSAHFALTRALADGTAQIDKNHWQTGDVSWYHDHFYAAKGPGLAFVSLPLFVGLKQLGLAWDQSPPPGTTTLVGIPREAVWPYTLLVAALPALALLILVGGVAERWVPGTGAPVALGLGLGTIIFPYSTLYAPHVLGSALSFGAFALLCQARGHPRSVRLAAAAGVAAGGAVVVDYPYGVVMVILGVYVATCLRPRLRSATAYGVGAAGGVLPLLIFNAWAFGSPLHQAYVGAVLNSGETGHDQLGANAQGFFGISMPHFGPMIQLLLLPKGLFTATPIVAAALAGLVLLYRQHRAEVTLIACVAIAYLLYSSGRSLPGADAMPSHAVIFGGDTPGPRFLIPMLVFAALGISTVFAAFPLTMILLALISFGTVVVATLTGPMTSDDSTRVWFTLAFHNRFAETVFTRLGGGTGWLTVVPTLMLCVAAIAIAVRRTTWRHLLASEWQLAAVAVAAWAIVAWLAPLVLDAQLHWLLRDLTALGLLLGAFACVIVVARRRGGSGDMPARKTATSRSRSTPILRRS